MSGWADLGANGNKAPNPGLLSCMLQLARLLELAGLTWMLTVTRLQTQAYYPTCHILQMQAAAAAAAVVVVV